jgi:hypothetical protein
MSVDASNASAAAGVDSLRARVTGAIKQAANTTGASFHYLLATAKMESDFNPTAGASTSSAHGLYQADRSDTANMPTRSRGRRPATMSWSIRRRAAIS